jgi:hypothetical protein
MTRTTDQQIEAASYRAPIEQVEAAMRELYGLIPGGMKTFEQWKYWLNPQDQISDVMLKLLSGHYAEEPLPQITHPGKAWSEPHLSRYAKGWQVYANLHANRVYSDGYGNSMEFRELSGPTRPTQREAILAWNAGLERV